MAEDTRVCDRCKTVRVEDAVGKAPGTVGAIAFLPHDDERLPALIRAEARTALETDRPVQPRLL